MDGSIMSAPRSVWVGVQVGERLILLICESCQRPLEDASVSGGVTYSYFAHTEGRVGFEFRVGRREGGCCGVLRGTFVSWHLKMDLDWGLN